jgi:hypothetical protein
MAVRPPQGGTDEPEAIAFGIAALDARLDESDLSFPATTDEILEALGEPSIPYDAAGNTVALSAALSEVPHDRFEREGELLDALHPVFEAHRERTANSVLARLRGLLPF